MNSVDSQRIVDDLSFCVIDLETTGGNHSKDKIIEIGMVKIQAREVVNKKSFLINPEIAIPEFIQNLTNISQKDVEECPTIDKVIHEIIEFISDDIIVAHNTSFDVPFLNSVLKRLKKPPLKNNVICTNVMTKHLIPEILNSNLTYMSRLFNIEHSMAHRAYDDALATAKLLIIYLNIFIDKGIKKVNQLYYPRNKFELDRLHFDHNFTNKDILEFFQSQKRSMLMTIKGERGLILAVLPLQVPEDELEIISSVLNSTNWNLITVRLMKPVLDGLFHFNNHFKKYPEEIRDMLMNYLSSRYHSDNKDKVALEKIDFLLTHHLVTDQVIAYSFLHLNTNTKQLFKIPAQKKKLYQYLNNQINRFESNQKGQKKQLIHHEIKPLIENFLTLNKGQNKYLYLDRKSVKESKEQVLKTIESFSKEDNNDFNFPSKSI
ncbi:MAG: 3'-5' exonuclease [Bacteriovoracaceae bacterium]|jgi:DNA polymerase-3 subunit alpha (Gram-positive type)|nr:hypothetical protein [Halobacteriovoraceae bacterium]MDP7320290.1 3'-5' exonuclease [Bacteriovoracaceae bacterium]